MRIARFSIDGNVAFGAVEGEGTINQGDLVLDIIKGIPFADFELSGTKVPLTPQSKDRVRLLPPVLPSKVVAFGRNYAEHAAELGNEVPDSPFAFFKPSTSVIGSGDPIAYPPSRRNCTTRPNWPWSSAGCAAKSRANASRT